MNLLNRIKNYKEEHCWQYDIRLKNLERDLIESNLTENETKNLKTSDFVFKHVTEDFEKEQLKIFIKKHEWLGTIPQYTSHWFACYYNNILSGVILMGMPNAFSSLLGSNTRKLERLINRGACISWTPKNLASKFLMWSIKYVVKNDNYRLFTAYSDPTAKEIGTIYQACNFFCLGQRSGTSKRYINPYNGNLVSDRIFRTRGFYKKYAKELNIEWKIDWNNDQKILWDNIPKDIEIKLRSKSKEVQNKSEFISFPLKYKYAYVLGRDRKETKYLRNLFLELNSVEKYPKRIIINKYIQPTFNFF